MKRLILTLSFVCLMAYIAMAVPARRGLWQTMTLADGSTVRVELRGDEHYHYFQSTDNRMFVMANDQLTLEPISAEAVSENMAKSRRLSAANVAVKPRKITHYTGKKKGIILLVQYTDVTFKEDNDKALYEQIVNGDGYTSDVGFVGSVKDYFRDQSRGQFELEFDVFGPITLAHERSYYGGNDIYGNDKHPEEMVIEGIEAIKDTTDFSPYDWDGDGVVDQVFVVYAGKGEANGGSANTVWPHEWQISAATGSVLTVGDMAIDTYGCSNELNYAGKIDGVGTFCHEFSHCLGFPDLYDTAGSSFGMDCWSIMDYGCYNGDGYVPCGYTSYERMSAGWIDPIELTEETRIEGMKSLTDGGDAYIIYNDAHPDEYYLLENRQQTGWDTELPASGLLILHVDYDEDVWAKNTVNNVSSHQRCSIFHADNSAQRSVYSSTDVKGDPYPYDTNNSLTNKTKPKASLFNNNSEGKKLMSKPITGIEVEDSMVSFDFCKTEENNPSEGVLFCETFDECTGSGGNNGVFSTGASSTFRPDMDGWEYSKAYGGDACARFGSGSYIGTCATPSFTLNGSATLTFRAAPWGNDGTTLNVEVNGEMVESLTMVTGQWTDYSIEIESSGDTKISFLPSKRFFLDEVVVKTEKATSVRNIQQTKPISHRIYTISGQYVGTDFNSLGHGLYIVDGQKRAK